MGLSRRRLLKSGAITGLGGVLLARSGSARKKQRSASNSDSDSANTGADSLVRFPGTKLTYQPFTQTFHAPRIMGFASPDVGQAIDPSDGTVRPTANDPGGQFALTPAPGSAQASLGSNAVYHGIAPEYSRANPTHEVANRNDSSPPPARRAARLPASHGRISLGSLRR